MKRIRWAAGILVIVVSCDTGNPVGNFGGVTEVSFNVGASCRYVWHFEMVDSLGNLTSSQIDTVAVRVAATDEIQGNDSGLVRIEAYSLSTYRGVAKVWYKAFKDSLIEVAYSSVGVVPIVMPKRITAGRVNSPFDGIASFFFPKAVRLVLRDRSESDSVTFRSEKRVVYKYPLLPNVKWVSFQYPFLQTREVVSFEHLQIGATTFISAKIQTRLPGFVPDIEWYDYVDERGLLHRSIFIPKVPVSTEVNPEGVGWVNVTERLELLSRQG